jgi:hypothetical protein
MDRLPAPEVKAREVEPCNSPQLATDRRDVLLWNLELSARVGTVDTEDERTHVLGVVPGKDLDPIFTSIQFHLEGEIMTTATGQRALVEHLAIVDEKEEVLDLGVVDHPPRKGQGLRGDHKTTGVLGEFQHGRRVR